MPDSQSPRTFSMHVNGKTVSATADAATPLLWVLRDQLSMRGTKYGCGAGLCGACTVLIDGSATRSCQLPVSDVGRQSITTIEGVAASKYAAVQSAWLEEQVPQCGYCQSGMIVAAVSLLSITPEPSDEQINEAMTNLCRCGTYDRVRRAIHRASAALMKTDAV